MRTIICLTIMVLTLGNTLFAQRNIEKTISTNAGQTVYLDLEHPNVKIKTWNKNEISIKGTASINNGQNDDAFELKVDKSDGNIYIETGVKNKCKLPRMISADKDGERIYVALDKNEDGWDMSELKNQFGDDVSNISIGTIVEIELEIMVPKNIELDVKTLFGNVDINNFYGGLNVKSTHGSIDAVFKNTPTENVNLRSTHSHVDVSIPENANMDVQLRTSHGEILTNIELDYSNGNGGKNSCSSQNKVVARMNNGGTDLNLIATHNKIYLRKL